MIQTDIMGPVIMKMRPAIGGEDNVGIGITLHGEEYLLKQDPYTCIAEFVGAAVCRAVGIPATEPCVVHLNGAPVFGSRLEAGVNAISDWFSLQSLLRKCHNINAFSAVLAVDLALGNKDRHWANWLYQTRHDGSITLRAVDFSRAWPTCHPPGKPDTVAASENTRIAWTNWPHLGIQPDEKSAKDVTRTLATLGGNWLDSLFNNLPVEWKVACDSPALSQWWASQWEQHVLHVDDFIESGAWK